jgi:hypothetical protein
MPEDLKTQTRGDIMRLTNRAARGSLIRISHYRLVASAAAVALAAVSLVLIATPGAASAARPSGSLPANLAKFADCPVDNPAVTLCLYSKTSSTTFDIGSTTLTSTAPSTVSFGVSFSPTGVPTVVLPDDGSQALQSPAIPLPGGLIGIPGAPDGGALAVNVTPQLVGLPTLSLNNLLTGAGPGLTLPIDVLVSNSSGLLGSDCTIADAADPITLNLTTGATNPPAPNTSITGSPGKIKSKSGGRLEIKGLSLVDNAFAVPGANDCGPSGILDSILNVDKGLPSAAGSNTAILAGNSFTAPASLVSQYLG